MGYLDWVQKEPKYFDAKGPAAFEESVRDYLKHHEALIRADVPREVASKAYNEGFRAALLAFSRAGVTAQAMGLSLVEEPQEGAWMRLALKPMGS